MEANPKEVLGQVFPEILENLAFMFADEADPAELQDPPEDGITAAMEFTGQFSGSIAVTVPAAMCLELAANMLGVDEEDERAMDKARDALKELLNITCGHVLTSLAGEEPVFDLSVPRVEDLDPASWPALTEDAGAVGCLVDDAPLLLRISVSGA
ncbi:MAG: chemotaxis protein CheX [bacterium]|nr:chemotaxis protein CheX [bacterium]